jgi:hypothetical protein
MKTTDRRGGVTPPTVAHRDASRTKLAPSVGGPCPGLSADEAGVLAQIRDAGQYISPSRLHHMYARARAAADQAYDEPQRHTYIHARQSHPIDTVVGERAVSRTMRRLA